jgi:hypothetical protein
MTGLVKQISIHLATYFVICLICGIIKTEFVLNYVDRDILAITRLSSYISTIISIIFAILFIMAMLFGTFFLLQITGVNPEKEVYGKAVRIYVFFYIVNEVTKAIMAFIVFDSDAHFVIDSEDAVGKMIVESGWHIKTYIVDCCTFFLSLSSYLYVLYVKSTRLKKIDLLIAGLFLTTIFALTHRDFINF